MFGPRIQQRARQIAEMVVRPLAAIGVTPNMATLLGLLLNGIAAAIIAGGNLRWGGVMLLFAGLFDMVDGALARVANKKTTFGAFFDSTLDRYSEGIVLLGVILYAVTLGGSQERTLLIALSYIAALSSLMVSYARARAEGLGLSLKSGLMARPERVLLLAAGLMLGGASLLLWTVGILAVTSTFTAIQRIVVVWRMLAHAQSSEATDASASRTDAARADASRPTHGPSAPEHPRASAGISGNLAERRPRPTSEGLSAERPANR